MGGQLTLLVGNNNISVYNADPWILWVLDQELRYPTPVATAREGGWQPPVQDPGEWDGWIRLFRQPATKPPWFPTGLLDRVEAIFKKMKYSYSIEDKRRKPEECLPEFPEEPLADRDYQVAAVERALTLGRGVLDMPPRSGKSQTGMAIVGKLGLPTIWIAPTDAIVRQTLREFERFFGQNFAMHQVGTSDLGKAIKSKVVLCTYATAVALPPEFYNSREVLLIDEFHHGGAKTIHQLVGLCGHIYYRIGMTGTFFRSGEDDMAMHALLSQTIQSHVLRVTRFGISRSDQGGLRAGRERPTPMPQLRRPGSAVAKVRGARA